LIYPPIFFLSPACELSPCVIFINA
jgi:hypothetical protein